MSLISICIAVYQNENSIVPLYNELTKELSTNFPEDSFEYIFVNDGSKDGSLPELLGLHKIDKRVKIISFSRNFGQMAAILAGWKHAQGDAVINMAADLQDPPSQCTNMIQEWKAGNEIVISYRKTHDTNNRKKITSKIFYRLLLPNAPPGGFDFALIGRKPMDAINSLKEHHRFYQYDILWVGFSVKFIPYNKQKRPFGKSQYNFIKRFRNFYSAFLNVSYLPLRFLTSIGFIISIIGFIYSINIAYTYYFHGTPFKGWAPIMMLILIIGGLIMLMIGIIGEYIWRILDEVKGRPNFIIDEIFD